QRADNPVALLTYAQPLFLQYRVHSDDITQGEPIMYRNTLKWTLWLTVFALALTTAAGLNFGTSVNASGGSRLGTSPFDFSGAAYRAHGIVPENIVLRVGTAARAGDSVIDNSNTDPNRANVRTIETTPGTTGSSGLTYANIFGALNSTSFERNAAGQLTTRGQIAFDTAEH